MSVYCIPSLLVDDGMADNVLAHHDLDNAVSREVAVDSWNTLRSIPSNATVVRG